jgi:hypothetical protein
MAKGLFAAVLAVAFYYLPLPEAADRDLDEFTDHQQHYSRIFGYRVFKVTFVLALSAQVFGGAAHQEITANLNKRFDLITPEQISSLHLVNLHYMSSPHIVIGLLMNSCSISSFTYVITGFLLFAGGHLLAGFMIIFVKPR